jgi:DNA-binding transcriptional LysR family regulator
MVETAGRITLWGIEVFQAIAEERSISLAARRLGASPSSVSQQLSNLENALGVVLIDRSARPLGLSPAGELFRRRAGAILDEADQARAELALSDFSRLSRFRLGVIEDFEADITPLMLSEMAGDLSSTRFLLETGPSHQLAEQLDMRALDMIVAAEMGPAPDWAERHPLMEEPFVAVVPKGEAGGLDALRERPFIQYSPRHYMGRVIADHLTREGLALDARLELDSYHAIMALVAAGAGWTILTPLGVLRAHRFVDKADILPLPMAPLSRRISLTVRAGMLGEMPAQVAMRMKAVLEETLIAPACAHYPALGQAMRVL